MKKTMTRRGAPRGNANALKHGKYTREHLALYAAIRAHIREGKRLIAEIALLSARIRAGETHGRTGTPQIRTVAEGAHLLRGAAGQRDRGADICASGGVQA